jgi:hypothetical protein
VEYGPLVGLIVTNLVGNVLYLISVYRADISVVGSLWPLKSAYLPLLAWALPPHTVFPTLAYALILAATLGAVLVAYNGRLRIHSLTETPVALMAFLTVPVFALSDYFLNQMVMKAGSPLTTTLTAWALAGIAVPAVLAHPPSRKVVAKSVKGGRAILGAALTGIFLLIGVVCIGEAFKRGGMGGLVLVNVYAMTSGVVLLLVNLLRPGWLEGEERSVYLVRIVGAIVLIAAAGGLRALEIQAARAVGS